MTENHVSVNETINIDVDKRLVITASSQAYSILLLQNNTLIGSAECSLENKDKNIWYFNRLLVKEKYCNKGYGTILINHLLGYILGIGAILHLDINPYGWGLTYEQLREFYTKKGFVEFATEDKDFTTFYYNYHEKEVNVTESITKLICNILLNENFIIQRYLSKTTNSIYLKLDYGVCNSIRISDHPGKKNLHYRYNVIIGGEDTIIDDDGYTRFYYNENSIHDMIQQIRFDRCLKIDTYGNDNYGKFMRKNYVEHINDKGFWSDAEFVIKGENEND